MPELDLRELMIRMPVVLLALTVHEFCHAYFAYRMGDPTAARLGRCTLNPLKHLDPLGTLCLMFAPIGWAKPVPINWLNFEDRRKGIIISTAAGPVSNLVQAVGWAAVLRAIDWLLVGQAGGPESPVEIFLGLAQVMAVLGVVINVGLAVFNCLPLYPLDGFHITLQLLPARNQESFANMQPYGPFLILGLVLLENSGKVHILSGVIVPIARWLLRVIGGIA